MAAPGDVDIVIAAEWMEAGRAIQRGLVTPDRTVLIASTHRTFAVSEKSEPGDGAANSEAVTAAGQAAAKRFVAFDMARLAEQAGAGPALVAAALLDNKRADLVGEKTFGEGAQQKTFELPDGAALILSVAKYESPSGKKLQDDGVTPDVLVASNFDQAAVVDDDATPADNQPAPVKPTVTVDDQLSKALALLKNKAA